MRALIVNYGVGNLFSVASALRRVGFEVVIDKVPSHKYDLLILPGVGSFNALEKYFKMYGQVLRDVIVSGIPTLGICLGMQAFFEYSDECGGCKGLGILKGYVGKLVTHRKLPHIGWDRVYLINWSENCEIFKDVHNEYVYFAHSYVVYPESLDYVCMVSLYDSIFPATIGYRNILGTQFHIEKSGRVGRKFFDGLVKWVRR
jgi:glutamine amidotransferase